jgi:Peptidase dimerisation domain/Peptidase family M20/M25/M40
LLLNAHLDTVGVGGADAGLSPRVVGNRLYGRGALDMKGSLGVIMLVAAAVAKHPVAGDLIVAAVADEEAYSIGTEAVAKTVRADAAIVAEPTEMQVVVAHKGFVWLDVATDGVAAHGSRYDLGVDAIARMGPVLVGLAELDERLRAGGEPHALLGGASVHASLIEGGHEPSTYPDRCVVKIERRTLPGETVGDVEKQLTGIAGDDATVKTLFAREPLATAPGRVDRRRLDRAGDRGARPTARGGRRPVLDRRRPPLRGWHSFRRLRPPRRWRPCRRGVGRPRRPCRACGDPVGDGKRLLLMTVLETERLKLREFDQDDLDDLAAMVGDEEQMTFLPAPEDLVGVRRRHQPHRRRRAPAARTHAPRRHHR